jgi:hypothetical protein
MIFLSNSLESLIFKIKQSAYDVDNDFSLLNSLQDSIRKLEIEALKAEKEYDLNKAAEITYKVIQPLQQQVKEAKTRIKDSIYNATNTVLKDFMDETEK